MPLIAKRVPRSLSWLIRGIQTKQETWTLAKDCRVKTTTTDSTVADTCRLMRNKNVGAVIVMDGDNVAGIFTDRDVVKLIAKEAGGDEPVDQFMTKVEKLATVTRKSSVSDIMNKMLEHNIRHIPIVDLEERELLHMISIKDVINTSIQELNQQLHNMRWYTGM